MKKLALAAVVAAATMWGMIGLFVRHFQQAGLGSMETTQIRMTAGMLLLGLYLLLFHREKLRIRLRDLWCFLANGVIGMLLCSYFYFRTIALTSLAVAGVLLYTAPIFVMLLSALIFRERITRRKTLALVLAVAGCALVSGVGAGDTLRMDALLLGLGSGLSYALYSIFSRFALQRGYDAWTITFYTFFFCAVGCGFFSDWSALGTVVASGGGTVWLWMLLLGLMTAFMPYLLYTWGLQRMEASRASILASVEPVVATLVGVIVFHEVLSLPALVGIGLVLGAIVVLSIPKGVNNP